MSVYTIGNAPRINSEAINPALRLSRVVTATSAIQEERDLKWITRRIVSLSEKIESRKLSLRTCINGIKILRDLGYLKTDEGLRLILATKTAALRNPSDLDDYETLAKVITILPSRTFSRSEMKKIREAYSEYAEDYALAPNISDPEELRDEASRIEDIGDSLGVDTDYAEECLRDAADEIENEQGEDDGWVTEDGDRGGGGSSEECSDSELDSMFGTL